MSDLLNTYLGRFLAVIMIIVYSYFDLLYGFVLCLAIILVYELNVVPEYKPYMEGMEGQDDVHDADQNIKQVGQSDQGAAQADPDLQAVQADQGAAQAAQADQADQADPDLLAVQADQGAAQADQADPDLQAVQADQGADLDSQASQVLQASQAAQANPDSQAIQSIKINESMVSNINNTFEAMTTHDSLTDFRKEYCKNTDLYYKGLPVKSEMAQHIFPQIQYKGNTCNLCDPNCEFSIALNKIDAENEIVKPKSSNDYMLSPILGENTVYLPYIGVISEAFSWLK